MKSIVVRFSTIGTLIIAVALFGLVIVKPVLAQVDATSSDADNEVILPVESVDTVAISIPDPEEVATETGEPSAPESPSIETSTANAPSGTRPEGLTEVQIIGTKYIDYFTDGTNTYEFPGDSEIHAHISEKDAPIPTREGLTWVHSTGNYLYDTATGDLEVGQYAVQPNGAIIASYPAFVSSTSTAPTTDTSSGDLSSSQPSEIEPGLPDLPSTATSDASAAELNQ